MPHLHIETNLPSDKIPTDFVMKATQMIADTLETPVFCCAVSVNPNLIMSFGGTSDPCAVATLKCITGLGIAENKAHSAVLAKFMKEMLGISDDKMFIFFITTPASDLGFKGTTFDDISR